ncbi:MAG TPA: methyltransferase domain-containing protein [Dongiaceae bacterium]|nr:methyltransferase domain-containing protein [Dongiaceae bacterium]
MNFWILVGGCLVVLVGTGAFFGAPYVPTKRRDLRRMFDALYKLTKDDVVLDIGSGDGIVLRETRRMGAQAVGYEINPFFVLLSRVLSWGDKAVAIRWANAFTAPFPDNVTFIYAFAVGRDGKRLARKVQREADRLHRPLLLVCYGNPLPNKEPAQTFEAYCLYRFLP